MIMVMGARLVLDMAFGKRFLDKEYHTRAVCSLRNITRKRWGAGVNEKEKRIKRIKVYP